MIALIDFKDEVIMTREEAEKLKLNYTEYSKDSHEGVRVGISNGKLVNMSSYMRYTDELTKNEDGSYMNEKGEEVPSYMIAERPTEYLDWVYVEQRGHLVDLFDFAPKCKHTYYITKSVQPEVTATTDITHVLKLVADKTNAINKTLDTLAQKTFNKPANVHIGGGLLTTYNELMLRENECTDELQKYLVDGWRIIAVCVQPDQRRPDYILARYNPKLDASCTSRAQR